MKKEKSCGIIVFKDRTKILLVHHNLGHWGLPKGHVEKQEKEEETAKREVLEETGINAKIIPGFREVITYSPKENVIKDVVFFIGTPINTNITIQEEEVSEAKFIDIDLILDYIGHDEEKTLIMNAINYYKLNDIE